MSRVERFMNHLNISLINFVDEQLLRLISDHARRAKTPMIILCAAGLVAGAIGMPG